MKPYSKGIITIFKIIHTHARVRSHVDIGNVHQNSAHVFMILRTCILKRDTDKDRKHLLWLFTTASYTWFWNLFESIFCFSHIHKKYGIYVFIFECFWRVYLFKINEYYEFYSFFSVWYFYNWWMNVFCLVV